MAVRRRSTANSRQVSGVFLASNPKRCAVNPSLPSEHLGSTDWWDVSQVDGWTLPYKVKVVGDCPAAPDTSTALGSPSRRAPTRRISASRAARRRFAFLI